MCGVRAGAPAERVCGVLPASRGESRFRGWLACGVVAEIKLSKLSPMNLKWYDLYSEHITFRTFIACARVSQIDVA